MKKIIFLLFIMFFSSASNALTLNEAVDVALKNNPSVSSAAKQVESAKAVVSQAGGAFFPVVKLQGSTGTVYNKPQIMQLVVDYGGQMVTQTAEVGFNYDTPTKNVEFSVVQPIFTAGKLSSALGLANKSYNISYQNLRKTINDTVYNTTVSYFAVIKSNGMLDLAKQSKSMAQDHLLQIKSMTDAGVATKSDILRVEVQSARADVFLSKAKNAVILAKNLFNNTLGLDLGNEVKIDDSHFMDEDVNMPKYGEVLAAAFESRPEWIQFKYGKGMYEDKVNIARSELMPMVSFYGSYGASDIFYHGFDNKLNNWKGLLVGSWNLFDLKLPAKVAEAQSDLGAQKDNEATLKNAIELDVNNAFLELESVKDTLNSAKEELRLAEQNYEIAKARYKAGVAINLEVIDAQVALTQAQVDRLQAQFDLKTAKAKLNKVVGKEVI